MKKVILLTGNELRHQYFCRTMALQNDFEVIAVYCEGIEESLQSRIEANPEASELLKRHAALRAITEQESFASLLQDTQDNVPRFLLSKGDINEPSVVQAILDKKPDILACYGSSLVRGKLLEAFRSRFLGVHLGLSPYYRGSGTNIWPLVNGEPEYVGATFMRLDSGIDTGEIIHQIRARLFPGDSPHQIGNRLIADMCQVYPEVIRHFDRLAPPPQPSQNSGRLFLRKDFDNAACARLYDNFKNGLVEKALSNWDERVARVPITQNESLGFVL